MLALELQVILIIIMMILLYIIYKWIQTLMIINSHPPFSRTMEIGTALHCGTNHRISLLIQL